MLYHAQLALYSTNEYGKGRIQKFFKEEVLKYFFMEVKILVVLTPKTPSWIRPWVWLLSVCIVPRAKIGNQACYEANLKFKVHLTYLGYTRVSHLSYTEVEGWGKGRYGTIGYTFPTWGRLGNTSSSFFSFKVVLLTKNALSVLTLGFS